MFGHPGYPGFEVGPVEVLKADLGAWQVLDLTEVVQEAFQADSVGLDRLGVDRSQFG